MFRIFTFLLLCVVVATGCAPTIRKPERVCPGAASANKALSLLELHSDSIVPLRANGQCFLEYYSGGKKHKENFPVKIWMNPPVEIYLQGDVAFDPKGVVLGSNKDEFWLTVRLKEISSYWWGRWSGGNYFKNLAVNPGIMLEVMGVGKIGQREDWFLSKEGAYDVLAKKNSEGAVIRKMYVYNCDYLVRKIEYFDANEQAVIVAELGEYKKVSKDFFVPGVIKISRCIDNKDEGPIAVSFTIELAEQTSFMEKQREMIFRRPEPDGFKRVLEITGYGQDRP